MMPAGGIDLLQFGVGFPEHFKLDIAVGGFKMSFIRGFERHRWEA
jgi:hypothetical protein